MKILVALALAAYIGFSSVCFAGGMLFDFFGGGGSSSSHGPSIILESGEYVLLESGDSILLE